MPMEWKGIHEGPLPHLRDVLQKWLDLNERTVQEWEDGDISWRYNERATLGIFAGAIWLKGGFVIEEYSARKSRVDDADSSEYFGRPDMWFELDGREYDIEAKICNKRFLSPSVDPTCYIDATMQAAMADAKNLKQDNPSRVACGLVMSVPLLSLSKRSLVWDQKSKLEGQLMRWVSAVKGQNASSAWFLRQDYKWHPNDGVRPNCLYPGVALMIKPVDH